MTQPPKPETGLQDTDFSAEATMAADFADAGVGDVAASADPFAQPQDPGALTDDLADLDALMADVDSDRPHFSAPADDGAAHPTNSPAADLPASDLPAANFAGDFAGEEFVPENSAASGDDFGDDFGADFGDDLPEASAAPGDADLPDRPVLADFGDDAALMGKPGKAAPILSLAPKPRLLALDSFDEDGRKPLDPDFNPLTARKTAFVGENFDNDPSVTFAPSRIEVGTSLLGTPRKFDFTRRFDAPAEPPKAMEPEPEPMPVMEVEPEPEYQPEPEPEPPPAPTFSEEELAAAKAVAYAEGEAAGMRTAMASLDSKATMALEMLAAQIPALTHERDAAIQATAREAARIAHAIVERMLPALAERYGLGEMEAVIADSLAMGIDQSRILVRVHPDARAAIEGRLDALVQSAGFQGQVQIVEEAGLGLADIKVEWGDGGAERLMHRAWDDISGIVDRALAGLGTRAGQQTHAA